MPCSSRCKRVHLIGFAHTRPHVRRWLTRDLSAPQDPTRRRPSTSSSTYPPSYRTTDAGLPAEEEARAEEDPNAAFEMQHQSVSARFPAPGTAYI